MKRIFVLVAAVWLGLVAIAQNAPQPLPGLYEIPPTDEGFPGAGPIRR